MLNNYIEDSDKKEELMEMIDGKNHKIQNSSNGKKNMVNSKKNKEKKKLLKIY